jgi:hypothetical protein
LLAAVLAVWPLVAHAESGPSPGHSADQVWTAFIQHGYAVEEPLVWDWLTPPVTTFHVRRGVSSGSHVADRVLLVHVYADAEAARLAERQAESINSATQPEHLAYTENYGPRLVAEYGASVWRSNVALVESTRSEHDTAGSQRGLAAMLGQPLPDTATPGSGPVALADNVMGWLLDPARREL